MTRSHFEARACSRCGLLRQPTEFYAGAGNTCKDCHKAAVKLRRLTDPKVRAYDRERAKLPHRRQKAVMISARWREEHPVAYAAHTAVGNALRDGRLERKPCEVCGTTDDVHAHHKDYAKSLEVVWLCARCHHRLHALFPELEGVNKVFANGQ